MWEKLVDWFGGKTHFSFLLAFVAINVGFYLHNDSTNFAIYAGTIMALCGFQTGRSIMEDKKEMNDGK